MNLSKRIQLRIRGRYSHVFGVHVCEPLKFLHALQLMEMAFKINRIVPIFTFNS
jgi:hypothetical protein